MTVERGPTVDGGGVDFTWYFEENIGNTSIICYDVFHPSIRENFVKRPSDGTAKET